MAHGSEGPFAVQLDLTGTGWLLMHSSRGVNPMDPLVREMKVLTAKRKKSDEDHLRIARMEFEIGMYHDEEIGPYVPSYNLRRCLVEGARFTRRGKDVERGVLEYDPTDVQIPLIYPGPRTIDGLWKYADPAANPFVSQEAVGVAKARLIRTRPRFQDWTLSARFYVDASVLNFDDVVTIANQAGAFVGLGDYRPRYGRFTAIVKRVEDE